MSGLSEVSINLKEDKTSEKYQLALRFVNKILVNIGKSEVDELTKFINIDREDIIKEVNKITLDDMADELFEKFNKKKVGYYRKTDSIVLNCLRGLMKEIGYELTNIHKDITTTFDGKNYRKTHLLYSIK